MLSNNDLISMTHFSVISIFLPFQFDNLAFSKDSALDMKGGALPNGNVTTHKKQQKKGGKDCFHTLKCQYPNQLIWNPSHDSIMRRPLSVRALKILITRTKRSEQRVQSRP